MARTFNRSTVLYMYEQMVRLNPKLYQQWGDELFMLLNANGPGYLWQNATLAPAAPGTPDSASEQVAVGQNDFNLGELIRIKRLATRPMLSRFIRFGLRHRLDERIGRFL